MLHEVTQPPHNAEGTPTSSDSEALSLKQFRIGHQVLMIRYTVHDNRCIMATQWRTKRVEGVLRQVSGTREQ